MVPDPIYVFVMQKGAMVPDPIVAYQKGLAPVIGSLNKKSD